MFITNMIAKCKNIIFSDTFRVNLIKCPWNGQSHV